MTKKIGYIAGSDGGVEYHRLIRPFGSLAAQGYEVTRYNTIPLANVHDVDVDVLVFNRHFNWANDMAEVIHELQTRGIKVICDVDDYWVLPSSHIIYDQHKTISPFIQTAIRLSDEVWATHEQLANRCRLLNPNVRIVPNAIELDEEQWQVTPMNCDRSIGYVAGVTHIPDLAVTVGAWSQHKGVKYLCGITTDNAKIFASMGSMIGGAITYAEARDVFNYGTFYDLFDIAIAPLADTAFNRCKSNLKILEAGAKGRPILAQRIHPYYPFDCDGVIHVTEWKNSIKKVMQMPVDEIEHRGLLLREHIERNYSMTLINQLRIDGIR